MRYTIGTHKNNYIVKKNGEPISLVGVGLLTFKTKKEASDYIKMVHEAAYYIKMGVPE